MIRLIDGDKLLNKIDAYMCGSQDVMFVKELIKEQPTTYDVDKIYNKAINDFTDKISTYRTYDEYGNMVVSGFNIEFPRVKYIVGTVSDHVMEISGKTLSLTEICGKNTHIYFELR